MTGISTLCQLWKVFSTFGFYLFTEFLGQLISYSDTAMFGFYGVCNDADSAHGGAIHNNRLQAVSYAFQGELKRWSHGFG